MNYSTSNLHTLIIANATLLNSLTAFSNTTFSDLNLHVGGSPFFADGLTKARHTLSQIDLNNIPSDTRDPGFNWTGLLDKFGNIRPAVQAAQALLLINNDLTSHENSTANAHIASAISVSASQFLRNSCNSYRCSISI